MAPLIFDVRRPTVPPPTLKVIHYEYPEANALHIHNRHGIDLIRLRSELPGPIRVVLFDEEIASMFDHDQ